LIIKWDPVGKDIESEAVANAASAAGA